MTSKHREAMAAARSRRYWPITSLELRRFRRAEGAISLGRPRAVTLRTGTARQADRLRRIVWAWIGLDPTQFNRNLKRCCSCIFLPRALLNVVR